MKTIFGVASGNGRAGVAVMRISGDNSTTVLKELGVKKPIARKASLHKLIYQGEMIDEALVLYFPAPHSFTGEDVVELHTHGSRAVTKKLLEVLAQIPNLRLAEPGEFSKRAFQNDKMDLAEAEGLADLIEAETAAQARQAIRQMQGETSAVYDGWRHKIISLLANIEAYIDFPDEDLPNSLREQIAGDVINLEGEIAHYLNDNRRGEKIRDGIHVAIIGAPNVGKSSILNYLAKRDAAIVSETAGTTRDVIEVVMELGGFKVIIADTAGIRETSDEVESEGIKRALKRAEEADVKLIVFDGPIDEKIKLLVDNESLVVMNKSDLTRHCEQREAIQSLQHSARNHVSSKTGEGMDELIKNITQKLEQKFHQTEAPLITQARHREALVEALNALRDFSLDKPIELMAEDLRYAAHAIGRITGKIDVDDILDVIFSSFCIGK